MTITANEEDQPLAHDKLDEISTWVADMKKALFREDISYGELIEIDNVYDLIKE
jgi:hypothetical protein